MQLYTQAFDPTRTFIIKYRDNEDKYWIGKKKKIQDLLGEQKFAVKGKGDAWSGFLYRVREAPHMTDGFRKVEKKN